MSNAHAEAHDREGAVDGIERAAGDHHPHVLPVKTYLGVWVTLVALTALTVAASYASFGAWNLIIALVVATTKAALVAGIFMHLKYDSRFNAIIVLMAVLFLGMFIGITRSDIAYRGDAEPIEKQRVADLSNPFEPPKRPTAAPTTPAAPAPAAHR